MLHGYNQSTSAYPQLWTEDGYVHTGASGAVGTVINGKEVLSVTRNSTGNYTLNLNGLANILSVQVTPVCPTVTEITPQVQSIGTAVVAGATVSSIVIQFQTSGSAADPPSGGGFLFRISMSRSQLTQQSV